MGRVAARIAKHWLAPWSVGLAGLALILVGARPYAGGWNDGSRLAAVESLLERETVRIDNSVFCQPAQSVRHGHPPYSPAAPFGDDLLKNGTRDKLFIDGHFYSDKPAVISLLMAAGYRLGEFLGLPRPGERPDHFCWYLTLLTSGLAYLLSLLSLYRLGAILELSRVMCVGWVASCGFATVALAYTRHVNNHILLLAVISSLCLHAVLLARAIPTGRINIWRLIWIGTLTGVGFNLDLGAGPPLVLAVLGWAIYRCRRFFPVAIITVAALPWGVAWLGINNALGGTWKPIAMVPEFMTWPGSPFSPANMTGFARADWHKLTYPLELLVGPRGFIFHNLPMLLLLPAFFHLVRCRSEYRPELIFAQGWCTAVWLEYGILSNNYSGNACSIRWFVPFLAPNYFLIAVYLRDCPRQRPIFWALSAWGTVLSLALWWQGPWAVRVSPLLWPAVGAALITWGIMHRRTRAAALLDSRSQSMFDQGTLAERALALSPNPLRPIPNQDELAPTAAAGHRHNWRRRLQRLLLFSTPVSGSGDRPASAADLSSPG